MHAVSLSLPLETRGNSEFEAIEENGENEEEDRMDGGHKKT